MTYQEMTYQELVQAELTRTGIKIGDRVRSYDFPVFTRSAYVEGYVIAIGPWECNSETCWHYHIEVNTQVYSGEHGPVRVKWAPGYTVYPSIISSNVPGGSLVERLDPVPTESPVPTQGPSASSSQESESTAPVSEITPSEERAPGPKATETGL